MCFKRELNRFLLKIKTDKSSRVRMIKGAEK